MLASDGGFAIAARVRDLFDGKEEDNDKDAWNQIRNMAASTFGKPALRMAATLELARLAVLLGSAEIMQLDLAPDLSLDEMVAALQTLAVDEWPDDLHLFWR